MKILVQKTSWSYHVSPVPPFPRAKLRMTCDSGDENELCLEQLMRLSRALQIPSCIATTHDRNRLGINASMKRLFIIHSFETDRDLMSWMLNKYFFKRILMILGQRRQRTLNDQNNTLFDLSMNPATSRKLHLKNVRSFKKAFWNPRN